MDRASGWLRRQSTLPQRRREREDASSKTIAFSARPRMAHTAKEMKFLATPEKGEVSALLVRPGRREAPARPRPRGRHEHATRHPSDYCRADGRCGHRDFPLQLSLHGARQGTRLPGGLYSDRPLSHRGGARGRPGSPPAGRIDEVNGTREISGTRNVETWKNGKTWYSSGAAAQTDQKRSR